MSIAHVTELTALLREGPAGKQLKAWPTTMRGGSCPILGVKRERPAFILYGQMRST